jgi:hypothetical protein
MTTRASRSFTARSRERIQAAKIVERLIQCLEGEIELTKSQIHVATSLLDRVLPKLRTVDIDKAEPPMKSVREMTTEELHLEFEQNILAARGKFAEAGYIHKDRLAEMGYVHVDDLNKSQDSIMTQ